MLEIIFWLILVHVAAVIAVCASMYFLALMPEFVQDMVTLGCGCLIALVGLLIIIAPIAFVILELIDAFCD